MTVAHEFRERLPNNRLRFRDYGSLEIGRSIVAGVQYDLVESLQSECTILQITLRHISQRKHIAVYGIYVALRELVS